MSKDRRMGPWSSLPACGATRAGAGSRGSVHVAASPWRARPGLSTLRRVLARWGKSPVMCALHERKRLAILNVCADALTTSKVERSFNLPSRAQGVDPANLARRARRARGLGAPGRLPARGTHVGHRATLPAFQHSRGVMAARIAFPRETRRLCSPLMGQARGRAGCQRMQASGRSRT